MLWGCSNDTCPDNRSTVPLAGFYDSEGKSIGLDSLLIYGLGGVEDSTIVASPGTTISKVYLPMRTGADQTTWVISYKQQHLDLPIFNDTVTLSYTSTPYFASAECGVVILYRLTHLSFTTHIIDTVDVTDSLFNNVDIERIKILFRTSSQESPLPAEIPHSTLRL